MWQLVLVKGHGRSWKSGRISLSQLRTSPPFLGGLREDGQNPMLVPLPLSTCLPALIDKGGWAGRGQVSTSGSGLGTSLQTSCLRQLLQLKAKQYPVVPSQTGTGALRLGRQSGKEEGHCLGGCIGAPAARRGASGNSDSRADLSGSVEGNHPSGTHSQAPSLSWGSLLISVQTTL